MNKSSNILNLAFFLLLISALCATLVSGVHSMTQPIIREMEQTTLLESYQEVYPDFDTIEETSLGIAKEKSQFKNILLAYKNKQQTGVIYNIVTDGYAGPIDILLAFDLQKGQLTGVKVLKQTETPGLGANAEKPAFIGQFTGKSLEIPFTVVKSKVAGSNEIQAITASTITSQAIVKGINLAREHFLATYYQHD